MCDSNSFVNQALKNSDSAKTAINNIIDTVIEIRSTFHYCNMTSHLDDVIKKLDIGLSDGKVIPIDLGMRPTKWKMHPGIVITSFRNWKVIQPFVDSLFKSGMKVRVEKNLKTIPKGYELNTRWYFLTNLLVKI
jgi:hypothetical protein